MADTHTGREALIKVEARRFKLLNDGKDSLPFNFRESKSLSSREKDLIDNYHFEGKDINDPKVFEAVTNDRYFFTQDDPKLIGKSFADKLSNDRYNYKLNLISADYVNSYKPDKYHETYTDSPAATEYRSKRDSVVLTYAKNRDRETDLLEAAKDQAENAAKAAGKNEADIKEAGREAMRTILIRLNKAENARAGADPQSEPKYSIGRQRARQDETAQLEREFRETDVLNAAKSQAEETARTLGLEPKAIEQAGKDAVEAMRARIDKAEEEQAKSSSDPNAKLKHTLTRQNMHKNIIAGLRQELGLFDPKVDAPGDKPKQDELQQGARDRTLARDVELKLAKNGQKATRAYMGLPATGDIPSDKRRDFNAIVQGIFNAAKRQPSDSHIAIANEWQNPSPLADMLIEPEVQVKLSEFNPKNNLRQAVEKEIVEKAQKLSRAYMGLPETGSIPKNRFHDFNAMAESLAAAAIEEVRGGAKPMPIIEGWEEQIASRRKAAPTPPIDIPKEKSAQLPPPVTQQMAPNAVGFGKPGQ